MEILLGTVLANRVSFGYPNPQKSPLRTQFFFYLIVVPMGLYNDIKVGRGGGGVTLFFNMICHLPHLTAWLSCCFLDTLNEDNDSNRSRLVYHQGSHCLQGLSSSFMYDRDLARTSPTCLLDR